MDGMGLFGDEGLGKITYMAQIPMPVPMSRTLPGLLPIGGRKCFPSKARVVAWWLLWLLGSEKSP